MPYRHPVTGKFCAKTVEGAVYHAPKAKAPKVSTPVAEVSAPVAAPARKPVSATVPGSSGARRTIPLPAAPLAAPVTHGKPARFTLESPAPIALERPAQPRPYGLAAALACLLMAAAIALALVVVFAPGEPARAASPSPASFRKAEIRSLHLHTCDLLRGRSDDVWQVEAARMTAVTGARYTVGSLATSCALANSVRPVTR